MNTFLRYCFAPSLFGLSIGLAVWLLDTHQAHPLWLLAVLLSALAVNLWVERRIPFRPRWNQDHHDTWRDTLHALTIEGGNVLFLLGLSALGGHVTLWALWPAHWPLALQLLLALVCADLGITLVHWASHRSARLWRLHAVHHSVERMYGFNGWMKHPLHQALEACGGVLPLLLLGMGEEVAVLLAFSVAIQLLLQHSNADIAWCGPASVMAWAPVHRWHHLRYGRAGDVNFGLFFTLWDRLLGTWFAADPEALAEDDLGIGSQPNYPRGYLQQLLAPWQRLPHQPCPPLPARLRSVDQAHAAHAQVGANAQQAAHAARQVGAVGKAGRVGGDGQAASSEHLP
ncbi:sterol desaturase family protein [Pseudomonas cremoricolorata]|uniref:sterol desaturase family protein n=1 Tax=Pseudomonas cremoricolorata TaxID=157783 RepID=UPI0009DF16B9|nr:sterol desaturase family protein [Pseudomonas cremoricolorata]